MDANNTDEDPGSSLSTTERGHVVMRNTDIRDTFLVDDPVFIVITAMLLCLGAVFLVREIFNRIKNHRYRHRRHPSRGEAQRVPRVIQTPCDDPPPYPGKYSKTNINYLPSYDSAIKMAPELRMCDNTRITLSTQVFDESDRSEYNDISNEETQNLREDPCVRDVCLSIPISHEPLPDHEFPNTRTATSLQQPFQ